MGVGEIAADLIEKCKTALEKAAEGLRSHLLAAGITAGAVCIILVLLLILAVVRALPEKSASADVAAGTLPVRGTVPADEFFLPDEPDFVPDVVLEREPRSGWSEEDARAYWTDPLEGNEERWLRRIESGIESLLEHVP